MTPSATLNVTKEKMQRAKEVGLSRWGLSLMHLLQKFMKFRGIPGSFDLR